MDTTSVLVISKSTDEALRFRKDLGNLPGYSLIFKETAEKAMESLTSKEFDCVIFNFEKFGMVQVKLIQDIKGFAKVSQVLVFADAADPEATKTVKNDRSLIVIEKAWLNPEKDLVGLCHRLIKGGDPKFYREAVRHTANQTGSVHVLDSGRHYNALVKDISEKGACLEVNTLQIKKGDKVKITVQLDKLNRERIMFAEIRWVKPAPGRSTVGVRFYKPDN